MPPDLQPPPTTAGTISRMCSKLPSFQTGAIGSLAIAAPSVKYRRATRDALSMSRRSISSDGLCRSSQSPPLSQKHGTPASAKYAWSLRNRSASVAYLLVAIGARNDLSVISVRRSLRTAGYRLTVFRDGRATAEVIVRVFGGGEHARAFALSEQRKPWPDRHSAVWSMVGEPKELP